MLFGKVTQSGNKIFTKQNQSKQMFSKNSGSNAQSLVGNFIDRHSTLPKNDIELRTRK